MLRIAEVSRMSSAPDAVDETIINLLRRHTDPDQGLTADEIAKCVGPEATTVRDRIQTIVHNGWAPIGQFGSGYFMINRDHHYEQERQSHLDTKQQKQSRIDGLEQAYNRHAPPTGETRTDGGQAAADVPQSLADAVDAMVERHGVGGAESRLQDRFRDDDQERAAAALSYLRRCYEVDA